MHPAYRAWCLQAGKHETKREVCYDGEIRLGYRDWSLGLGGADAGGAERRRGAKVQAAHDQPAHTGPDGLSHVEEIEAKFAPGGETGAYKLMANAGAELRRAAPGRVADWHTAPRRQYVITLSGHGELEVAGGKKIQVGPGSINLVEDVTGKGHITRTVGNEDRVTIQVPLVDR